MQLVVENLEDIVTPEALEAANEVLKVLRSRANNPGLRDRDEFCIDVAFALTVLMSHPTFGIVDSRALAMAADVAGKRHARLTSH